MKKPAERGGFANLREQPRKENPGGQGGIRTHDTLSHIHAFQACAFNHSATCPYCGKILQSQQYYQIGDDAATARNSFRISGARAVSVRCAAQCVE